MSEPIYDSRQFNPELLRMAMNIRGMETADLADILGILDMQVELWLNGTIPAPEDVTRIAVALQFPPSFFCREYQRPKGRTFIDGRGWGEIIDS